MTNLYRVEITLDIYAGSESEALAKAYLIPAQPWGARMVFDVGMPELVAEHVDDPGSPENRAKRNAEVRARRAGPLQDRSQAERDPPVAVFPDEGPVEVFGLAQALEASVAAYRAGRANIEGGRTGKYGRWCAPFDRPCHHHGDACNPSHCDDLL